MQVSVISLVVTLSLFFHCCLQQGRQLCNGESTMTHPRFPASNSNNSCSSRTAVAPGTNSNFNHSSSNNERISPEAAMDNPYGPSDPDNHDIIIEAGVEISVHHNNSTLSTYERTSKSSSHNPKMAICR